ncbi:MAG: thioredoxin family protein [Spirochaetaceae bacterium]
MKRIATVLICFFLALSAWGDIYEWKTDLEAAGEQAAEEDKYIFLYFAGSDWCGWCRRFKQEILDTRPFEEFAEENLVPVLIDFPRQIEQSAEQEAYNRRLAERFGVQGFPTVYLLTPDEDTVLQSGYLEGGPAHYVEHLRSGMR